MVEQWTSLGGPLWIAAILGVLLLAAVAAIAVRRYALGRGGGTVECYLREVAEAREDSQRLSERGPWRIGCGRYGTHELHWYRVYSLQPLPAVRLPRRGMVVVGRRDPAPAELRHADDDVVVVEVGQVGADGSDPKYASHELAMSEGALTGFLSWLEAAPPGGRYQL